MFSTKLYRHEVDVLRYEDHWGEYRCQRKIFLPQDVVGKLITESIEPKKPKENLISSEEGDGDEIQLPSDIYPANEVIKHTIRLHSYSKSMQQFIRALALNKGEIQAPPPYKLPEMPVRRKEKLHCFSSGQTYILPPLDRTLVHQMLEKAVLTILAQIGYEKVRRSALDTLVDVVAEFLSKICRLAHTFAQHDLNHGQIAYDDVLEKSLRTVGLDGIHSIKEYYKRRVLYKRDRALIRAKRLLTMYEKLLGKYGFGGLPVLPSDHPQPTINEDQSSSQGKSQ